MHVLPLLQAEHRGRQARQIDPSKYQPAAHPSQSVALVQLEQAPPVKARQP